MVSAELAAAAPSTLLLRDAGGRGAALEMAISHALLRRTARGELPSSVRIYRPAPTLAFGRSDRFRAGYPAAAEVARRHGFTPVIRLAGGHAAAYDRASLIYEEIVAGPAAVSGIRDRFRAAIELLLEALVALGADARMGELPGEYCAGEFSVNVAGATKVAGIAQRAVRGAALVSAVIAVGGGARLRAVLTDVYAALGIEWDPATAGAVEDELPGLAVDAVEQAVLAVRQRRAPLVPAALDASTLALARELVAQHVPPG